MRPGKIALLITAILVPVVGLVVVGLLVEARRQEGWALEEARAFARSGARLMASVGAGLEDEVEELARSPLLARALAEGDRVAAERFAGEQAEDPDLDAVVILDTTGVVVAARGDPELVALARRAPKQPRDLVPGGPGQPGVMVVRRPVATSGAALGELVTASILEVVDEVLVISRGRVAPTLVVNGRGEVVAGPSEWAGRTVEVREITPGPSVRIAAGDLVARGVAEPLSAPGTRCEVVTLLAHSLYGPPFSRTLLLVGAGMALLSAIATLVWALRLSRTERRLQQVLEELERERATFTRVLESSPDGILAVDPEGRIVLDNPAMRELFRADVATTGRTPEEVIEQFRAMGGQLDLDFDLLQALTAARAGRAFTGTQRVAFGEHVRHDEVVFGPLRFPDGRNGVLATVRDVTDRAELAEVRRLHDQVRSMAAIAQNRAALLEAVLRASDVGFIFVDRQEAIGYVTPLAIQLLGLETSPAGLSAHSLAELIARRTGVDAGRVLETGGLLELPHPRRYLDLLVTPVPGQGGTPIGHLISIRDETATRELEQARDEFFGIAAHELKNPLAALRLQADLGLRGDERRRGEALEKIGRKARELTELVERLLDVTRADLGRLVTERTPVDVGALAREVVEGYEGGTVHVRFTREGQVEAMGDAPRIRQVMGNLVSNAVRYAGTAGPIDVTAARVGEEIRVSVRDRGPGIPPEERRRIFERFGQGKEGRRGPGLGIGLYLARKIAEDHGGRLELESEEGKGSTFTLILPARPADRLAAVPN
jgi:PAS domain S-box-containing protein